MSSVTQSMAQEVLVSRYMLCDMHSRFIPAATPAPPITLSFNLDHDVHVFIFEEIDGSVSYILQVCSISCDNVYHTHHLLIRTRLGGFVGFAVVLVVIMMMIVVMAMVVMMVFVLVVSRVGMGMRMTMAMVIRGRNGTHIIQPELWDSIAHNSS